MELFQPGDLERELSSDNRHCSRTARRGGGCYANNRYGARGLGGVLGLIVVLIALCMLGALHSGAAPPVSAPTTRSGQTPRLMAFLFCELSALLANTPRCDELEVFQPSKRRSLGCKFDCCAIAGSRRLNLSPGALCARGCNSTSTITSPRSSQRISCRIIDRKTIPSGGSDSTQS